MTHTIHNLPAGTRLRLDTGDVVVVSDPVPGALLHDFAPVDSVLVADQGQPDWIAADEIAEVLPDEPSTAFIEDLLSLAIRYDRTVEFQYAKADGQIEPRRVDPSTLLDSHGHKIVLVHDHARNDIRAFRLDRIVGDPELV